MISPQDMADAVNGGPARLVFYFRARRRRGRDGDTADDGGEEKPIRLSHRTYIVTSRFPAKTRFPYRVFRCSP